MALSKPTVSSVARTGSTQPQTPLSGAFAVLCSVSAGARISRDRLLDAAQTLARELARRLDPGDGIRLRPGASYRAVRATWTVLANGKNHLAGELVTVLTRNGYALHDDRRPIGAMIVGPERRYLGEHGITPIPFASREDIVAFVEDAAELLDALAEYHEIRTKQYAELAADAEAALAIVREIPENTAPQPVPDYNAAELAVIGKYQDAAHALELHDLYVPTGNFRVPEHTRVHPYRPLNGQDIGAWVWVALWLARSDVEPKTKPAHQRKSA